MKQLLAQLTQIWSGGTPTQRVLGILSLVIVGLGIGGGVWFAMRPDHALLFGNLDPADAGLVVEQVRKAGVEAEVRGGGTAVYVPSNKVDEMRMIVAQAGLPKTSGTGWELFDTSSFGISDFVQNINFLRAKQTSLERAIAKFDGVESATVEITKAKESAFVAASEPAKASVMVALKAGRQLSPESVRAITHLVAGAIDGLDASNVSVMDTKMHLLSEAGGGPLAINTSNQIDYQRNSEDYLGHKAEGLLALAGIAGAVRVNLDIDFQHVKQTSEKFDPVGTATSETLETSSTQSGTNGNKGAVSAKEQIDPKTQDTSGGETSNETKETSKTEKKVGRTVKSEENATPVVKRLSVSLVVQDQFKDKLKDIEKIVKSAVGFDDKRGDVLNSMVGALEAAKPVTDLPVAAPMWPALVERGIQIVGVLGALFVLLKLIKAIESKPGTVRAVPIISANGTVIQVEPGAPLPPGARSIAPEAANPQVLTAPTRGGVVTAASAAVQAEHSPNLPDFVRETVKTDPAGATRVLQSWLREGEHN